jgi:hypothetical protein
MANYLARVELHNANYQDYENLHQNMANRGYARVIVSDQGKRYKLPTGTYIAMGSNANLQMAYNAAVAAAQETGKRFWVVVVEWPAARFQLDEVD